MQTLDHQTADLQVKQAAVDTESLTKEPHQEPCWQLN